MTGKDDKPFSNEKPGANVVAFPHSRVSPAGWEEDIKNLGMGKMAQSLGVAREQQSAHWCSRCTGIWYGYLLEVECPKCGSRQG